MNETCKSCGTVFEVDESILKNILNGLDVGL